MRKKTILCGLIALALALTGSADASGRDYLMRSLPDDWHPEMAPSESTFGGEWWKSLGDPMLDSLMSIAERTNFDINAAARRIEVARQAVRQAAAGWYPQLGVNAGWQRERVSGRTGGRSGDAAIQSYFSASATMNWEVDVFGKNASQVRHARASQAVSAAEYSATLLSLEAEIANTYISLLVNREQLDVARHHTEMQEHVLDITETRYRTGLVSKLDVAQARTLYYSTVASIPLLESSIEAGYNALGVLLGTGREGLPKDLYAPRELPSHYALIPMGAPLNILRKRPDIIQAEKNIDVASAALGIARKDYLPSLNLSASVGTAAHNIGDLFTKPSFTYSIAPTLSWTIFDGLSRESNNAAAKENLEIAVDDYNTTVLTAMEEVHNSMSKYTATLKYIDSMNKVVENSAESVTLSLDQYKQGLTAFYNVVEAMLNYLTYQNSLVEAKGNSLTALVDLYKALGGAE